MTAFVRAFGRFWYDFLIGDDWKIAASVVAVLVVGAVLVVTGALPAVVLAPLLGLLLAAGFVVALAVDTRRR